MNMNTRIILSALLVTSVVACGDDDEDNTGSNLRFDTVAKIEAFLDGKTLTMTGNNIPTEPLGFNENINLGAGTQCYNQAVIVVNGTQYTVTSDLGTLQNAPMVNDIGVCDRDSVSTTVSFMSHAVVGQQCDRRWRMLRLLGHLRGLQARRARSDRQRRC